MVNKNKSTIPDITTAHQLPGVRLEIDLTDNRPVLASVKVAGQLDTFAAKIRPQLHDKIEEHARLARIEKGIDSIGNAVTIQTLGGEAVGMIVVIPHVAKVV